MRAHFVLNVFLYLPKSPFYIFTYQKISQILREYLCRPLSIRVCFVKKKSGIYQTLQHIFFKSSFRNLQQNIISHQPWQTELADHTNLVNKTLSNLAVPLIFPNASSTTSNIHKKLN